MPSFLLHWFTPHHSNNHRAKTLHPSSATILAGLFALFQISLNLVGKAYPQVLGYASQISPLEIVRLTNQERARQGLSAVTLDTQLSQAAAQKAADMFARDYWAHVSPQGVQPWHFITQSNYAYRYAGENLARDFSDPDSVIKAWIASPSHRDNLLNPKYQDIGVAVVDGKLGGRDTTLVVQFFGTRISGQPLAQIPGTQTQLPATLSHQTAPRSLPAAFSLTKYASILLLATFVAILTVDIYSIKTKHLVRWTSKSFAHLIFMGVLLAAAVIVSTGQIT